MGEGEDPVNTGKILAQYPSTAGLKAVGLDSRGFRKIIRTAQEQMIDEIKDFSHLGILRWRCIPSSWKLENNCLENKYFTLSVNSNGNVNITITDGWESLYYYQKSIIPVLEISFGTDVSEIITEIRLK